MATKTATPAALNISANVLAALPSEGRIAVETVEGVTLRGAWYNLDTVEWHGWIAERETYATVAARYVAAVTVDGERIQVLTAEESAEIVAAYYAAEVQGVLDAEAAAPAAPAEEATPRLADDFADSVEIVPVPVEGRETDRGGRVFLNGHEFGVITAYLAADGVPYLWDARTRSGGASARAYGTRRGAVAYLLAADPARLVAALEAPADGEARRAAYADKERRAARLAARSREAAAQEAPAATLPSIPAEATALAVDRWKDGGETIVAIHDRTGREEADGIWGEFIGHVTLREDATEEDALAALRAAGWTEGDPLPYCRPGTTGTVTAWTR